MLTAPKNNVTSLLRKRKLTGSLVEDGE